MCLVLFKRTTEVPQMGSIYIYVYIVHHFGIKLLNSYIFTTKSHLFYIFSLWFNILTDPTSPVEESMARLTQTVYDLAKLYLRSFCPPSNSFSSCALPQPAGEEAVEGRSSKEASGTTDHLQFTLFALHGIPANWVSR